jgi:hypothetical protein
MHAMNDQPTCDCLEPQYKNRRWPTLRLHADRQDTDSDAWKRLLDLIDTAAADGRSELDPAGELGWEEWWTIVELPRSITKLKAVKRLTLYGSGLVRIPAEIGEMTALEEFDPYTSYRLHWFPYEITRCPNLKSSRVSTRALYGNSKYRPPFPKLPQTDLAEAAPAKCSVCRGEFAPSGPRQRWISLRVATDVLPLLVHACSEGCIARLPQPAEGYVQVPHTGGNNVLQPPQDQFYR